jgi:hypothetical protein
LHQPLHLLAGRVQIPHAQLWLLVREWQLRCHVHPATEVPYLSVQIVVSMAVLLQQTMQLLALAWKRV